MIRLGFSKVSIYPNTGVMIQNHGGTITFHGSCCIGNNSYISVGKNAKIDFGERFTASTTFRLVSYHKVDFQSSVRFGWDCMVMDTDFHKITKQSGGYSKGYAPISIGSNNWFGNGCKVLKRSSTPNYCIVSAGTILTGKVDAPEYSIVGHDNKVVVKCTGVWRNVDDDVIEYE